MRDDTLEALAFVSQAAMRYLERLDDQPVRLPNADEAAWSFATDLPEEGVGALEALHTLVESGIPAAIRSSGPR